MSMFRHASALAVLSVSIPLSLEARVVDHVAVQGFDQIPQSLIDSAVAQNTIYFSHASVGANITWGMTDLHLDFPATYKFAVSEADGNLPSGGVQRGTFYEYYRGNIGWEGKIDTFKTYLDNGWGSQATIAINKLCFVDADADWQQYAVSNANGTALAQLEPLYPEVSFVYCTIPVFCADRNPEIQSDIVKISAFNNGLRAWASANDKLLLDVADILSHDPAGNAITFSYEGGTYETLYEPYAHTADYLHLGRAGYDRVSQGIYELAAAPVPEPTMALIPTMCMLFLKRRR